MVLSNTDPLYKQCTLSVMDNIADPNITFNDDGVCNYYFEYLAEAKKNLLSPTQAAKELEAIVAKLKLAGKGKKYDCMLGVSGGVDSTYLSLITKRLGLRVLCVHFDNGWNSELAVQNIENIVTKCGFDLFTYVINWNEFKDIQLAYFKANVIDIEAVTDIAIFACLDKICSQHNIKYIIDGRNIVTESVIPSAWINKDAQNLYNIHKQFGTIPLKSYPKISRVKRNLHFVKKAYQSIPLLNVLAYNKAAAKKEIVTELNWTDYGGKHYESVFTRFYQGYILPNKFKVDKRKAHLSNLIYSGQLTKAEALLELAQPIYSATQLAIDKPFVLKKLGMTEATFDAYISIPPESHSKYGSTKPLSEDYPILKILKPIKKLLRK